MTKTKDSKHSKSVEAQSDDVPEPATGGDWFGDIETPVEGENWFGETPPVIEPRDTKGGAG